MTISITQTVQNVRTGPGTEYEVLGQLSSGEQAAVIGTSLDFQWAVINFRGQQGWLAVYLADISGDIRSVPVIPTPPTPTPNVPPTPTLSPYADVIIDYGRRRAHADHPEPEFHRQRDRPQHWQCPYRAVYRRRNVPAQQHLSGRVAPGLAPGQSAVVSISGILTGSGSFTVPLTVDANNQVDEGPVGEQNNIYNFSYVLGQGGMLNQGSATLNLGDTLDLEGNRRAG